MSRPKIATYNPEKSRGYKYAHLKRDGIWIELRNDAGGVTTCWTRNPTNVTEQLIPHPTVQAFLASGRIATLYCELYAPGQPASKVKSYLASGQLKLLRLECFACQGLESDAGLFAVQQFSHEACSVPFVPFHEIRGECRIHRVGQTAEETIIEQFMQYEDCEGVVFKDGNLLNWAKWKPTPTVDLVVTGFTEGTGKYADTIGAVRGAVVGEYPYAYPVLPDQPKLLLREVALVSGMTDTDRRVISRMWPYHLGKVMEVAYQYVGSQGRLRHPRFVRFRDDKEPFECTEDQLL